MASGYHILGSVNDLETHVENIGRRVAPWLWVFSVGGFILTIIGFAMTVKDKEKIDHMLANHEHVRHSLDRLTS